jgi:hypothetical protein
VLEARADAGLKRKAAEITRSAAEDFALLTTQTVSSRYAADFLSIVTNFDILSCNARKNRLFHDGFRHLLQNWDADTRDPQKIV